MASTLATVAVRAFAGDAAPSQGVAAKSMASTVRPYVNVPFSGHADAIPMAPGSIEAELLAKYGGGASSSAPLASSSSPSSPYVDPLSRVMPTIFVAGPAKSGSTFLWDCLQALHVVHLHGFLTCVGCASRLFLSPVSPLWPARGWSQSVLFLSSCSTTRSRSAASG